MSISSYQQKAFCILNKDFYSHSCVSLKFNSRSTGIQFLHDWLACVHSSWKYISCFLSIARMACHPSNSAKSWLFTIYMGKPVGSRFR